MSFSQASQASEGGDDTASAASAGAASAGTRSRSPSSRSQGRQVRAGVDISVLPPGFKVQPPLKAAEDHIKSHTLTLYEGLATLLNEKGRRHLLLSHRLYLKNKNLIRMETDESYIPVSARLNFKLQAWKTAEALPEYTALVTETSDYIKTVQLQLKEQILKNVRLERDAMTRELNKELCQTLFATTELWLVALGKDSSMAHEMVLALLQQHGSAILKHNDLSTEEFTALYRTTMNIPPEAQAYAEWVRQRNAIKAGLISVLTTSWDKYLEQQKGNEKCLSLKKKAKESLLSQASDEAAMEIDAEIPANRQLLQDLIQREATKIADKRMNTFRQEIASLKKAISPKNMERGQPHGASGKKKKRDGKKGPNGRKKADGNSNSNIAPDQRNATSSPPDDNGGNDSDWTTVSNRRESRRNRQSQPPSSSTPPPPRHRRNSNPNVAGAAGQGSRGNDGESGRRRSNSRSRNRRNGGGNRSTRSSRA